MTLRYWKHLRQQSDKMRQEVEHILHLPFVERITHHKARKPLVGLTISVTVMVIGVWVARNGHHITGDAFSSDLCGWTLHAMGTIPLAKYVEPVWDVICGAAEAV